MLTYFTSLNLFLRVSIRIFLQPKSQITLGTKNVSMIKKKLHNFYELKIAFKQKYNSTHSFHSNKSVKIHP